MMKKILLIDDDETTLNLLHEFIDYYFNCLVKVAHDGREGIKLIKHGYDYDLVITDINMPFVDGNEVARHIKVSNKSEIPIIAVTGSCSDIINPDFFSIILSKPFKANHLKQAIEWLI